MINAADTGEVTYPPHASPLATAVRPSRRVPDGLTVTYLVDASEPVLSGHFPGFPIFPGVCLVECANQAALLALPDGATLTAIDGARFRAPVFPGDEVIVDVTTADWACAATLTVRRAGGGPVEEAAVVRLRYRRPGPADGRR
jgi:3-hydroxyacyl-[acyl-carrier-protein] dehydratase